MHARAQDAVRLPSFRGVLDEFRQICFHLGQFLTAKTQRRKGKKKEIKTGEKQPLLFARGVGRDLIHAPDILIIDSLSFFATFAFFASLR